jgi:hypothetical protein
VQRLLQMEARVKFHQGDIDGALVTVGHMLKVGQTLDHQPTLIEHLVRLAVHGVAMGEIEFLLNQTQLTEPQLARLQQQLAAMDLKSGLTTGMLGERGLGYNTFQNVHSLADVQAIGGGDAPGEWESKVSVSVGRPADCEKYLEMMEEMIAASREPFPQARQRIDAVENKVQALMATRNPLERMKYIVTAMLTPATSKAFDAVARLLANREALVTVIAAERYRLKTGAFPTKIDELVPDFLPTAPTDPFSGQRILISAMPGEISAYSVGVNGVDDGGVETENRNEPDMVVRVKAAKGSSTD